MDLEKKQAIHKNKINLAIFMVLMFLTVLCTIQNVKAGETSEEVLDKLADDLTDKNKVEEYYDDSLSLEDLAYISQWKSQNPQYIDINDFVTLDMRYGISYRLVKGIVPKNKLPLLYKLLEDEKYAPYWSNIAKVTGLVSDDPNTVPILLKYVQRDDGRKVNDLKGKVWSLAYIGKIGGKEADSILKKAITKEGAKEFTKNWLDAQLWQKDFKSDTKEKVIIQVQTAAIYGLVFTGKAENWKIVEDLFNQHLDKVKETGQKTDIISGLSEAMGTKDYIAENNNDVESFFKIEHDDAPRVLGSYWSRYSYGGFLK